MTRTETTAGGPSSDASSAKSKRDWGLGIFFIVVVSVLWAGGSVLVQHIDSIGFQEPFVFVYIGSGVLASCIPSYLCCSWLGFAHNPSLRDATELGAPAYKELRGGTADDDDVLDHGEGQDGEIETQRSSLGHPDGSSINISCSRHGAVAMPFVDGATQPALKSHFFMFKIGLCLSVIWFFAQWTYVTSLAYTSVTSSTIIANSSALFTYIFNVMAKTERFTLRKTAGVALALLGAIAVGMADEEDDGTGDSLFGDAMALASAVAYGVYTVILTKKAPSDDEVSMSLILGYVGLSNTIIFLPVLIAFAVIPAIGVLHGLTFHVFQLIVAKSLFDNLLSELFWARAILLTTATVATVGCSLTIPIAFASDFVLHGKVPHALSVLGAFLVVGGFMFVSGRESGSGGGRGGSRSSCKCQEMRFMSWRQRARFAGSSSAVSGN